MNAHEFLENETEFRFGALVTEQPHPATATLSQDIATDTARGIRTLQQVDEDVYAKAVEVFSGEDWRRLAGDFAETLERGGTIYLTGCGSTGRLSIIFNALWRRALRRLAIDEKRPGFLREIEPRVMSVMAGGDFALLRAVEGFEDFEAFGREQIGGMGLSSRDLVVAITEGGETPFVIGTAMAGVDAGARTYFVYNNPDSVLSFARSQKVIRDQRIEKLNLTTGPMAITGSTRMQATTIEMLVVGAALERALAIYCSRAGRTLRVPDYVHELRQLLDCLKTDATVDGLRSWVDLEVQVYRRGGQVTYYADGASLDILSDTTERSPTFCVPTFRQLGEHTAKPSWAYLVTPAETPEQAWQDVLGRNVQPVEWDAAVYCRLLGPNGVPADLPDIGRDAILRFPLHRDAITTRSLSEGDALVTLGYENEALEAPCALAATAFSFSFPHIESPLDLLSHIGAKLVLNTVSTATMAKLGRVRGNFMVYVVPSNKKLIDRATRYVARLSGVGYERACEAIFEVISRLISRGDGGTATAAPVLEAVNHLTAWDSAQR